jgi:peptidoglycan/LPS O-acetylase OafA/YrhL
MGGKFVLVLKYLAANLVFLNFLAPTVPGLFEDQRFPYVNGALWTLKIEVMFYMILPILAWFLKLVGRAKWALLIAIYIAAEIWRAGILLLDIPLAAQIARQLPGQMSFFVTGISLWLLRDFATKHIRVIGLTGVIVLVSSFWLPLEFLRAAGLGGVVFFVAFAPGPAINAAKYGDMSYGVYITHFPIINSLVMIGLFTYSLWLGLVATIVLVLLASFIMWHLIERRFLQKSSHYRRVVK